MPIYAATPLEASRNYFIQSLYDYRRCKIAVETFNTSLLDEELKKRHCAKWLEESLKYYCSALDYALTTGADESKDFLIWLYGSKTQIISDFDFFAQVFSTIGLNDESNSAQKQSRTYLEKINQRLMEYPADLQQKMLEIDRVALSERLLRKPAVRKVYCSQFGEFLRRTREYPAWYLNLPNQQWLRSRHTLAKECSLNKSEDEIEWRAGIKFLKLEASKYETLDKLVRASIDFCFQWHEKNQLKKLKDKLSDLLKRLEESFLEKFRSIKSVGGRILKFLTGVLRVLSLPITIPLLLGCGGISGNLQPLKQLTTAVKNDCRDLWHRMKKNPWLSFFAILGLIGSSLFPLAHVLWGGVGFCAAVVMNELSVASRLKKTDEDALSSKKEEESLIITRIYEAMMEEEERESEVLRDNNKKMEEEEKEQCDDYRRRYKKWCEREQEQKQAHEDIPLLPLSVEAEDEIFSMMSVEDREEAKQEFEAQTNEVEHQQRRLHIQEETALMRIRNSISQLDHIEEKQQQLNAAHINTNNVVILPSESSCHARFFHPSSEPRLLTLVPEIKSEKVSSIQQRHEALIEKVNRVLSLSVPETDPKRLINLLNEREEADLLLELVTLMRDEKSTKSSMNNLVNA